MHAICHRFKLLSTHTPVFFDSATGTMGLLPTSFRVSASRGPMSVWVQQASCGKLLGWQDSRSLAQHCQDQGTSRSCSHLFSLHLLATLLSVPGSFGPKPCAPLVGPFSSGTLLGPGVTEGFKKGGISPSLLPG